MSIPAGWYPNPDGTPTRRWWDGGTWGDQVAEQPSAVAPQAGQPLEAPAGTSPYTAWVWVIVGIEALNLLTSIISALVTPHTLDEMVGSSFTPWDAVQGVLGLGLLVLLIVAANRDASALRLRGVPQPFPWGFIFFELLGAPVYMIGRAVVVRRRTGSGLAPMWIYLALRVAGWIISGIAIANLLPELTDYFQQQLAEIDSLSTQP